MKNNKWQKQTVKLSGFLLLLFVVLACNLSQNPGKSETESKKPETTKKETRGIEKIEAPTKTKKVENNALSGSDDLKKKVCKKYDECGCQDYEDCVAEAEDLHYEDAVWECMLNSSCESLCAGKPDACPGVGNNTVTTVPETPNCSGIVCTRNSDCPGSCHGGCSEGRCYLF